MNVKEWIETAVNKEPYEAGGLPYTEPGGAFEQFKCVFYGFQRESRWENWYKQVWHDRLLDEFWAVEWNMPATEMQEAEFCPVIYQVVPKTVMTTTYEKV